MTRRKESFKEQLARRCKIDIERLTGESQEEDIVNAKAILMEQKERGAEQTLEFKQALNYVRALDDYVKKGYEIK